MLLLLVPRYSLFFSMILGTAGHIDHGKTRLVHALTGVDTDRLPEEKRRGITIDLGFAPLALGEVGTVGVIDVPGHEAFVRTMVAGATGVDVALLVIAADEGVMPQTREHIAVLHLLGVRHAVVALTKWDLVDAEWMALAHEDAREALRGTPMHGAEIVPVSAVSGAGLEMLRLALTAAARRVTARASADLFRLPVDRAFTVKGTGTVVSGTVWSGTIARDAIIRLMPADVPVRVRGLHAFGRPVDRVHAGERAALALAGVELHDVQRGTVLVHGDAWRATRVLRADVVLLPDAPRALAHRTRVRLHLGTSDVAARIVVADGPLQPGTARPARIVVDAPLVARAGDRFVLRAESPVATIGGGIVTDPIAHPRARPWPPGTHAADRLLELVLSDAAASGIELGTLPIRLGLPPVGIPAIVERIQCRAVGSRLVGEAALARLRAHASTLVDAHHARHPLDEGVPTSWLRGQLRAPVEVATATLDDLVRRGALVVANGIARRPAFMPHLDAADELVSERLLATLAAAGREPPSVGELAIALGVDADRLRSVAHFLVRRGLLVAVEPERFYPRAVIDQVLASLATAMSNGETHAAGALRDALGVSRKYLIPLLEYCDQAGFSARDESGGRRWRGARGGPRDGPGHEIS